MANSTVELKNNKAPESKPSMSTGRKILNVLANERGWLYILPILALMALFTFYPIVRTLIFAFQEKYSSLQAVNGKGYTGWGFYNFKYLLTYDKFTYCLVNTLLFSFISVPLSTLLALLISVALNSIKALQKAYQTIFFLPYLTNALAIGAVFATMFQVIQVGNNTQTVGLINTIFHTNVNWLNAIKENVAANRFVVIVYEIWAGLPFKILILFGALQNVNKQYYDAAKIDGASKNTTLWKITVPLISPMISYLLVTGFIGGFKTYTAVVGIFGNIEGTYINTMVGFIYSLISKGSYGLASAGALILFVIIFAFTLLNLWVSKKKVHY